MSNRNSIVSPKSAQRVSLKCPKCGNDVSNHPGLPASQQRILELETQIKLLNTKAIAAADRVADYEDEIQSLRDQLQKQTQQPQPQTIRSPPRNIPNGATPINPPQRTASVPINSTTASGALPPAPPTTSTRLAALTSYLPGRRPSPLPTNTQVNLTPAPLASPAFPPPRPETPSQQSNITTGPLTGSPPSLNTDLSSLQAELSNERSLRLKAEAQLSSTSTEIEELTAQLFGQANEMVATERRQKAALEQKLKEWETRWERRMERIDELEKRVGRGERVRSLLSESESKSTQNGEIVNGNNHSPKRRGTGSEILSNGNGVRGSR